MRALIARIERLESHGAASPARPSASGATDSAHAPAPVRPAATLSAPEVAPAPLATGAGEDERERTPAPEASATDQALPAEDLAAVLSIWPAVVELVRSEHAMLAAVIADARPVALEGSELTLAFSSTAQFYRKKAEDPANRAIVSEAMRSLAPGRWRLSYELRDVPGDQRGGEEELSEDELVKRFIDEFEAEEVPGDWRPEGHADAQDPGALAANERGA